MGVDSNRPGFIFSWDTWVILGEEGKPPKFGASRFTTPSEEDGVILTKYCDGFFKT